MKLRLLEDVSDERDKMLSDKSLFTIKGIQEKLEEINKRTTVYNPGAGATSYYAFDSEDLIIQSELQERLKILLVLKGVGLIEKEE